jgi:outer membrane protein assembly factor BamA
MANLRFWEKRIHFYASRGEGSFHLDSLLDKDGDEIAEVSGGDATYQVSDTGMVFDYTDDLQDPRKGIRFETRKADSPREDDFDPLYYRVDYNIAAYIPIGKQNTWVFNYFQSDAVVQEEGETNRDTIRQKQGIDCSLMPATEAECNRQLDEIVEQVYANNKYGTASSLGGVMNMRSYPQGRFYAAHTMFYGTEFRWNLTEEFTPFDVFLAKGIRTSFQVAFFWEKATLADKTEDLGKEWVESYGTGFRMVLAGGFIFRLDVANGNEGLQTQLFLNYPWGLFN